MHTLHAACVQAAPSALHSNDCPGQLGSSMLPGARLLSGAGHEGGEGRTQGSLALAVAALQRCSPVCSHARLQLGRLPEHLGRSREL